MRFIVRYRRRLYGRSLATILLTAASVMGQADFEMNTALMQSTFKIQGPARAAAGRVVTGTSFFIAKPNKAKSDSLYVLVTAAHVLDEIEGDEATIILRERSRESNGIFIRRPYAFAIREKNIPLYKKHPSADVAVMYLRMPVEYEFRLLTVQFLATDERLRQLELHPGDELLCLGFPLAFEANEMGFPILRSGRVASYPLLPSNTVKRILFDFMVFPGNSGGPVYFVYETRRIGQRIQAGGMVGILGLLSQEAFAQGQPLKVGAVVPASFIKEAIDLLPERN